MKRRSIFAAIPAAILSIFGVRKVAAETIKDMNLPSGAEILKSFDARDWARAFVAHVNANPSIATDEETMVTWFANALMRGYDQSAHEIRERLMNAPSPSFMLEDGTPLRVVDGILVYRS